MILVVIANFRQDTLTEDTVDGAGLTKPKLVENQIDEVVVEVRTLDPK